MSGGGTSAHVVSAAFESRLVSVWGCLGGVLVVSWSRTQRDNGCACDRLRRGSWHGWKNTNASHYIFMKVETSDRPWRRWRDCRCRLLS